VNDHVGIYVVRPAAAPFAAHRYLRVCLQNGPSAVGIIPITVTAAGTKTLARLNLDGVQCIWLPAEQVRGADGPVVIRSGAKGKSILPFDDRILLYRVFGLGWTDRLYDDRAMSFFNLDHDIISRRSHEGMEHARVRLGTGWKSYETFGGESFRWAGPNAQLVVDGPGPSVAKVALAVEPGPSHGNKSFQLSIEDEHGSPVFTSPPLKGRNTLHFQLHYFAGGPSVYSLRTNSEHLGLANDPRILDYRVFEISVSR
jgi:hypothetical protein